MKTSNWIPTATIVTAAIAAAAWAGSIASKTFRTTAHMVTVTQGEDEVTMAPEYDFGRFAGHDLVNLALGTPLDTLRTNEVLALDVNCDSTAASLVVFDKTADSNIAVIATASSIDVVQQQDNDANAFPNRERFVAQFEIQPGGTATDGLLGGYLTIAGRLHLDPETGCPRAVPVKLDKDKLDKSLGDVDVRNGEEDLDDPIFRLRAGRGHGVGVLDVVTGSETNTVLVPNLQISIRRQLIP